MNLHRWTVPHEYSEAILKTKLQKSKRLFQLPENQRSRGIPKKLRAELLTLISAIVMGPKRS